MSSAHQLEQPELLSDPDLGWAHPLVREWFLTRFGSPTEPQIAGWPAILRGEPTLISAPTGSGKTLAAFLVCIDKLLRAALEGRLAPHTHVVYVSPLKALSNDVQKNLEGPLREIQELALTRGYLCPEIRTGVRTGDTLAKERAAMLRHPPHILVTTPESLYILLTANKPRQNLTRVSTVIVDEIHALADDKRGSHLALTLERLDALVCGENRLSPGAMLTGMSSAPQRIGLSATQNPIELVADFLVGSGAERRRATIVQVGQRRELDLAIEVPSAELGSLTSIPMWEEIYDKLAALALEHRSTLVFVNTRKFVEKISFELAARLGPEAVAAHHGSLSRALRLDAEQRLKAGEIRILVATASLELGIDIGNVDLVCQIATTRSVSVAMQRVGRAGHWRGATPKGRLFALTRDDLMEHCALVRAMRAGELDRLEIPEQAIDVLMQQIVAACGAESWEEDALFEVYRRAWPYRNLTRAEFDEIVALLHEGIESSRGRYGAYLLRDRVNGQLHARRGARMTAIGNGGAIPDTSLFAVMLQPENVQIATLDEHFAVDSSPGDVVLLGNTSWRIQRVDPQGKVLVEDAHGAPPSIPFWEGEAPQRTAVLSSGVSDLRAEIDRRTNLLTPNDLVRGCVSTDAEAQLADALAWIERECGVNESAARQLVSYIVTGRAVLGAVPTKTTIVAERFFDEGGGQQLILHAPFGGRLNKAWGLALRKRFCRGFNFELQAAATDNGINISLAEQHSFPLADVFQFLTVQTARELLEQASIPSPLFKNRWRWAAGRSLQLLRMQKGKRIAPQIQRTRSDDLLASVFPHASACPETMVGDIEIPDHPLVREVMRDTLSEAMDIDGLNEVLRALECGEIRCIAVDTAVPSQFAHEFINAMPYSFLDPEDAAARRTRAVSLSRSLPDALAEGRGCIDPEAIATVREQLWPDVRDEHELHDLLLSLVVLPVAWFENQAAMQASKAQHWDLFFARLEQHGRAQRVELGGCEAWIAAERVSDAELLWPECIARESRAEPVDEAELREKSTAQLVQGWLQLLGPTTSAYLGEIVSLDAGAIYQAMLKMEMQGLAMRGVFEHAASPADAPYEIEWCERRILHRIHRLTVRSLRQRTEPVSATVFMRWLLEWHRLTPPQDEARVLTGEEAVLRAIEQLEGFEAPAAEWERSLLPARVPNYDPRWLDNLCLAGVVGWGRVSPHPAWQKTAGESAKPAAPRRVIPTSAAPITFFLRESAEWLYAALTSKRIDELTLAQSLSPEAQRIRSLLSERGAAFTADLQRLSGLAKLQTTTALWELAAAGLAAADGFDQLRAMMDPRRKSVALAQTPATSLRKRAAARTTAGRWSLLWNPAAPPAHEAHVSGKQLANASEDERARIIDAAKQADAALEAHARILLTRYGVLFRELLARETNAPAWRDLAPMLRRLEARGEIRGGRFVSGPFGEQFALEDAAESLRASRVRSTDAVVPIAAADPLNLVGILLPGERVAAIPGRQIQLRNGSLHGAEEPANSSEDAVAAMVPTTASLWSEAAAQ
ncbi:MAG TPA: DEAD/DEAH box helicase [Acidobacteriaceae bacterium]|jgi:ATP-dependent Lhr-like helicase